VLSLDEGHEMVHRLNEPVLLFQHTNLNVHRTPHLLTTAFHVRLTYYVFADSKDSHNAVARLPVENIPVAGTHTRVTTNGASQHILETSSS
jgi:hypothetical protein